MLILVVEDDCIQLQWIIERLKEEFPDADIKTAASEFVFRQMLPELQKNPPSAVVMDIMLRWDDPKNPHPIPDYYTKEGGHLAGFRCMELLESCRETQKTPMLLYTVLPAEEFNLDCLPENASFLSKSLDSRPLIAKIREMTAGR